MKTLTVKVYLEGVDGEPCLSEAQADEISDAVQNILGAYADYSSVDWDYEDDEEEEEEEVE